MVRIILGRILETNFGPYVLKIKADKQFLKELKRRLQHEFSHDGHEVIIERRYHDD